MVLIPVVLVVVFLTPTYVVAVALAVVTVQALREYFALGDAIGHRAYRWWTIFCSVLLIAETWRATRPFFDVLAVGGSTTTPPMTAAAHRFSAIYSSGSLFFCLCLV